MVMDRALAMVAALVMALAPVLVLALSLGVGSGVGSGVGFRLVLAIGLALALAAASAHAQRARARAKETVLPGFNPLGGSGAASGAHVANLQRKIKELESKLAESAEPKTDNKDELEGLLKEIEILKTVSGTEAILLDKQARVQAIRAERLAAKPAHIQHKELDEKLDKRTKALERQECTVIPDLERRLQEARQEAVNIRREVQELQAKKDALLQRAPPEAPPGGQAEQACELLGKLRRLFVGPGAAPFQQALQCMETEVQKFKEASASGTGGTAAVGCQAAGHQARGVASAGADHTDEEMDADMSAEIDSFLDTLGLAVAGGVCAPDAATSGCAGDAATARADLKRRLHGMVVRRSHKKRGRQACGLARRDGQRHWCWPPARAAG